MQGSVSGRESKFRGQREYCELEKPGKAWEVVRLRLEGGKTEGVKRTEKCPRPTLRRQPSLEQTAVSIGGQWDVPSR